MRIKEIEARLAAIKQEIEQRGDAMTAAEIDALEQETTQRTEERGHCFPFLPAEQRRRQRRTR